MGDKEIRAKMRRGKYGKKKDDEKDGLLMDIGKRGRKQIQEAWNRDGERG